jgi:hypothetical protein
MNKLSGVISGRKVKPPRVIVYGPRGIGKTTFASKAPNPIIVQTEDGADELEVDRLPVVKSFTELMDNLAKIYREKHDFRTVVLDSIDWAEKLIHEELKREMGEKDFAAYGRGAAMTVTYVERLIKAFDALREKRGMSCILIAHSYIKRFNSPEGDSYDRYEIDLHQKSASICEEWADGIFFASQKIYTTTTDAGFGKKITRGTGSGERVMFTEERPAFTAKNRYKLPVEMPFEWSAFVKAAKLPLDGNYSIGSNETNETNEKGNEQ